MSFHKIVLQSVGKHELNTVHSPVSPATVPQTEPSSWGLPEKCFSLHHTKSCFQGRERKRRQTDSKRERCRKREREAASISQPCRGEESESARERERVCHNVAAWLAWKEFLDPVKINLWPRPRLCTGLLFRQVEAMDSVGRPIFPAQVLRVSTRQDLQPKSARLTLDKVQRSGDLGLKLWHGRQTQARPDGVSQDGLVWPSNLKDGQSPQRGPGPTFHQNVTPDPRIICLPQVNHVDSCSKNSRCFRNQFRRC